MKYCLISDGKITQGPCFLPPSFNNISGFHNLSNEDLATYGWLPFEVNENNDEENFKQVGSVIEITDTKVIQTNEFLEMTEEEKSFYQKYVVRQATRFGV
jgi:hypothetical protein